MSGMLCWQLKLWWEHAHKTPPVLCAHAAYEHRRFQSVLHNSVPTLAFNCKGVLNTRLCLQLELWREHAHKTLPVLMRATSMLVCGEDLGFLAPCVHPLMRELGLIGALSPPLPVLPAHLTAQHPSTALQWLPMTHSSSCHAHIQDLGSMYRLTHMHGLEVIKACIFLLV